MEAFALDLWVEDVAFYLEVDYVDDEEGEGSPRAV